METSCNQASVCLTLNYWRILVGLSAGLVGDLLLRCFGGCSETAASPSSYVIPSSKKAYTSKYIL